MPFESIAEGGALDIFCKAFSYDLVTELSQFKQFHIRFIDPFLSQIGQSVQRDEIDYVVKGSFSEIHGEIRVNVHLIKSPENRVVWSFRNKNKITAIQEVQKELLGSLVASLQQQLDVDLLTSMRRKKPTNFKAYEYWLFGMNELRKGNIQSDNKAREYFEEALAIDPGYSLAYSGMSLTYFNEWSCQIWDRWDLSQKGAKTWAQKALETDSENYIANLILGKILLFELLFDQSEIYLRKALRLNPNDPFNLIQIAGSFLYLNYLDEAEELYKKAVMLNPEKQENYHPVGAYIYFEKKEFEKCIETGERFLEIAWVDYPAIMAACYYYLGQEHKALKLWRRYVNNFILKIAQDKESPESEALNWMIHMNPYKKGTAFEAFWEFISENQGIAMPLPETDADETYNLLQREEGTWKVRYLGKVVYVPHSKGLADIAQLIANADKEIKQLISTDKIKSLEKAAVLCNIESVELRNQAINDVVEGGSLKHLKSLLKKDKGKLDQVNKQSKSNLINLGSTSKTNVAQILLQSILNNPELSNLKEQFYQVETNNDPKIISQTLKKVIKELESIYE